MKIKVVKSALILSGLIFSATASAYENTTHVIGGNIGGIGNQYYELEEKIDSEHNELDVSMGTSGDLYYRYMLSPYIGVETGFMAGGGGGVLNWLNLIEVDNFHYLAGRVALYGNVPLFSNSSLYGKAGGAATRISYEINEHEKSSTEYGFFGALGWQYRFNSGFGLNIEYQYMNAGNFETESYLFGASYAF
ncbi:hypothetical protein ABT56_12815 [Photobacterium aquae]|uniref:Outer membrane protein beta-barrel domain-containing protein n=1 Tax=Photobacterium aquae TaxID=1195763 RepID=A0A0J1GZY2_9GAMM|nr:porin family protein [Photobacterium aquae]KLV05079.1 hypothetical protein ABT56_12815 [Photobacterium aquae]